MKSKYKVLGHSLLSSLVRSHRSLTRFLRTTRFARALRCAHSLARSLVAELMRNRFVSSERTRLFPLLSTHSTMQWTHDLDPLALTAPSQSRFQLVCLFGDFVRSEEGGQIRWIIPIVEHRKIKLLLFVTFSKDTNKEYDS